MKSSRTCQFGFGLRTAAILLALASASLLHAVPFSYAVDIDTSALAANPDFGPYALDFQWNYGSGPGDTVQISNLSLTGGALAGTGSYYMGTGSGSLSSTLTLNNNTSLLFNGFTQQITAGVTDIRFNLTFSGADTGITPSGFSFAIDDNSGFPIYTNAPDTASLLTVSYTGELATTVVQTYASVAPSPEGVGAGNHVPDAANTVELLFGALLALGLGQRLRRQAA